MSAAQFIMLRSSVASLGAKTVALLSRNPLENLEEPLHLRLLVGQGIHLLALVWVVTHPSLVNVAPGMLTPFPKLRCQH